MIGVPTTPMTLPVHLLFEEQAATLPDSPAVYFDDTVISYSALNEQANRLAVRLRQVGVGRGERIGIFGERSVHSIVGMLAVLKAGAAYVPIEPASPDRRIQFLLKDAGIRVVIAPAEASGRLTSLSDQIHVLNSVAEDGKSIEVSGANVNSSDLAYVMYTSGSTGVPKGVLVSHRGIVQLARGMDCCRFGPGEVFLHHSSLAFDASTFEIWGPLLNGGAVAILPPGYPTPDALEQAIRRYAVTTLWLTAGLFHLVTDQRPEIFRPIRQLVAGGDVLQPDRVRRAIAAMPDGVLINGYGPTECTTFACAFPMNQWYEPGGTIPIGTPLNGATIHVLNVDGQPAPAGTPGELHIGGGGVALGYLNNPELTAERFVADRFSTDLEARLYKTGDRVRLNADGNLEFLGRLDDQIKISGYRIEPGEIEAVLEQFPEVRQALVIARPLSRGEKQLVAFLEPSAANAVAIEIVRNRLRELLPHYLVPARFQVVERFPLTSNGKIDRAALADSVGPETEVLVEGVESDFELSLLRIWNVVLRTDVNLDANFFDLGGTSLQLIETHSEICALLGREVPVTTVFQHPTVRTLAAALRGEGATDAVLFRAADRARKQREATHRRRQQREIRTGGIRSA